MSTGALEAVDRILNRGGDADEVLAAVVRAVVERGGCSWAAFSVDARGSAVAAEAGDPRPERRTRVPVVFEGAQVGELAADGCDDAAFLTRVALLASSYCATVS